MTLKNTYFQNFNIKLAFCGKILTYDCVSFESGNKVRPSVEAYRTFQDWKTELGHLKH